MGFVRRGQDVRSRYRAFFESHYEAVLAYALRRVDPATADDITAETFLTAWRRFDVVPADDAVPWLLAVARNLIANHRRGALRRQVALSHVEQQPVPDHPDPGEQVAFRADVARAFRRLSERDQEVLALVAWDGLTAQQGAAVLGCSVGAFWVRLHRARQRLAREMGDPSGLAQVADEPISLPDVERESG